MASPISTPAVCCSSSIRTAKQSEQSTRRFASTSNQFSQLGQFYLTSWTGLRNTAVTVSPKILKSGKKERCRGLTVRASLFGVGAPEALVIGVVALLVFGPKGLAEVARNLGKTLRAFQPTIRELQDVSREFKTTLEREIGLDDIPSSSQTAYRSNSASSVPSPTISSNESPQNLSDPNGGPPNRAYSSEEYLKITEEQLKASVSVQDKVTNSPEDGQTYDDSQAFAQEAADDKPLLPNPESKA